jgi:hypothetical protein
MTLRHLIALTSAVLLGGAAYRYINRGDSPDSQTDQPNR